METSNPLLKRENAFTSAWAEAEPMTLQGVINKSAILLLLCMGSSAFAWSQPELRIPFCLVGAIGGLIAFLVGMFKPAASPFAAPIYALLEGLVLGSVSQVFEHRYPGIVVNAMVLTFGVLGLMLMLYTTRIIRVTNNLVKGVFAATIAVGLCYLVDIVLSMFGVRVPMIHEAGWVGIGFSLVVVGIAAFNLLLDFSIIEHNVAGSSPKYMEWYCGMALLVTLVWLYLEILRLMSKLRGKN